MIAKATSHSTRPTHNVDQVAGYDHAPFFRARQQAEEENRMIEELDKHAAPLHWALMLAVIAVIIAGVVDQSRDLFQHYTELLATNEAMVKCLNGQTIGIDKGFLRCEVREHQLVAGLQPQEEVQP